MQYTKDTESQPGKVVYRADDWTDLTCTALVFDATAPEGDRCSLLIKPGVLPQTETELGAYLTSL